MRDIFRRCGAVVQPHAGYLFFAVLFLAAVACAVAVHLSSFWR